METAAIILAAGAGTRMKSKKPKVAHELLGKPLISWVVDAAKQAGIHTIVSVVGHQKEQVIPLIDEFTMVVEQPDRKGTADAVNVCRSTFADFKGSLVVLSGDCPLITAETITELIALREQNDAAAVVLTMELEDPAGYGRIIRDTCGEVMRIVEQKDATPQEAALHECNSGFYCFDTQVLFEALEQVDSNNNQGEFYLTDVLEISRDKGRKVLALRAEHADECLGINSRVQLAQATRIAQQRINTHLMEQGVTMTDPLQVWIGPDVQVAYDVEILPQVFLWGSTSIGQDCIIGPNTRLTNTIVGNSCVIDETVAIDVQIDDEVKCGPRAYLRPGTHMCTGSKAGTHVEIKKSTIGAGSKVPHLSYMGDATLGKDVNIGAGSITCNYDGKHKSATVIGDNVFVGSDTMMVAPVTIGDGAIIGAGSVITKDVSADALALTRPEHTEIAHWAAKRRKAFKEE